MFEWNLYGCNQWTRGDFSDEPVCEPGLLYGVADQGIHAARGQPDGSVRWRNYAGFSGPRSARSVLIISSTGLIFERCSKFVIKERHFECDSAKIADSVFTLGRAYRDSRRKPDKFSGQSRSAIRAAV